MEENRYEFFCNGESKGACRIHPEKDLAEQIQEIVYIARGISRVNQGADIDVVNLGITIMTIRGEQ